MLDDRRGQSVQIGAILLFSVLVVSMALYQATVVPQQNRAVEFNDYRDASADVVELRNAVLDAATTGAPRGVTVKTGSQYPARAFFVNPPPASGHLRTLSAANVTIANAVATGGSNERRYWDGGAHNVSTRRVVFEPGYSELRAQSVVAAYGFAYRDAAAPVPLASQTLVRGNHVSLVSVVGDLDASGYRASVTATPLSASTRTVTVTGEAGDPINLTVPTALDADVWESRVLSDQLDPSGTDPDRYVTRVSDAGPNAVTVTLEGDARYELALARVGLGETRGDEADAPGARYVVNPGEATLRAGGDGRVKLVAEARDRFDNLASDANVTFSADIGSFEDGDGDAVGGENATVRTDSDGRAVVWYNATGTAGLRTVDVYLGDEADDSLPGEKRFRYRVAYAGDGSGGGSTGDAALFILHEDTDTSDSSEGNLTLTLNSTADNPLNVTGVQLAHVTNIKGDPSDGPDRLVTMTLNGESRAVNASENLRPAFFSEDPVELRPGTNALTLNFDDSYDSQVMVRVHLYLEGGVTATFDLVVFPD